MNSILARVLDNAITWSISPAQKTVREASAIAKFDPEHVPAPENVEAVLDGYDAIQIGGSDGATLTGMLKTYEAVSEAAGDGCPVFIEPGGLDHIADEEIDYTIIFDADAFTIPSVRNTEDGRYVVGEQNKFNETLREEIDGVCSDVFNEFVTAKLGSPADQLVARYVSEEDAQRYMTTALQRKQVPEYYIVLNPDATVATKSGADTWLDGRTFDELESGVNSVIDTIYQQHDEFNGIIYFEGSGAYAPPGLIRSGVNTIRDTYGSDTTIWYGGGIGTGNQLSFLDAEDYPSGTPDSLSTGEQKQQMYDAGVDAVLVGNAIQ